MLKVKKIDTSVRQAVRTIALLNQMTWGCSIALLRDQYRTTLSRSAEGDHDDNGLSYPTCPETKPSRLVYLRMVNLSIEECQVLFWVLHVFRFIVIRPDLPINNNS